MSNRRQKHKRRDDLLERIPTVSKPNAIMRHVIAKGQVIGERARDYYLHATKGFRSRKS